LVREPLRKAVSQGESGNKVFDEPTGSLHDMIPTNKLGKWYR